MSVQVSPTPSPAGHLATQNRCKVSIIMQWLAELSTVNYLQTAWLEVEASHFLLCAQ